MATDKILSARTIQIHDVESNWLLAKDFVPRCGEVVIYDPDTKYTYSRFKIGDGKTKINDLPFVVNSMMNEFFSTSGGIICLDGGRITEYSNL